MKNELRFLFYTIRKNLQNSAELRTSFLINIVGMMINNTSFLIVWIFFIQAVGTIGGWNAADVVALQGFSALCFGIVFSLLAGIRKLPDYTSSGTFDTFLLSPKNLLMRTSLSSLNVSALGDVAFGLVCLLGYAFLVQADGPRLAVLFVLVFLTTIIFFATAVIIHSASFLFADAHAITSSLFEMFLSPALFHGGAFQGALRFVFTFVIPSLLIGTIPAETVRDLSSQNLLFLTLLAVFWLALSLFVFYRAVQRYESSNFMTFGG